MGIKRDRIYLIGFKQEDRQQMYIYKVYIKRFKRFYELSSDSFKIDGNRCYLEYFYVLSNIWYN